MSDPDGETCRLVELRAENFLRLQAVTIRPGGQVVEITGQNGEGKTSVLRAFWAAIEGKAALSNIAPVAIRRGADAGALFLDLGRVKITRTITRDEDGTENWSSLKLVAGDRRIATKPQAMLDAIRGDGLSLDPMEFSRWAEQGPEGKRRQFNVLRRLVPGFDFDANAAARKGLEAERTDVNRDAKRFRASAASIELPAGPEPEAADAGELMDELDAALRHNADIDTRKANRAQAQRDIDAKMDEAERLRARAATLESEAAATENKLKAAPPLSPAVDVAAIRARIGEIEATRRARQTFEQRRDHEKTAVKLEGRSARLTEEMAALDAERAQAIAGAEIPVPGLTLGEGEVLLDGLPFSQASTAEKIKAAMAIAMATAGDLKVVMIDEGSELDSRSLAVVEGMVKGTPFMVLVCRVDESGERGWVIEDGRVARAPKGGK